MRARWTVLILVVACGSTGTPPPAPGACGGSDALVALSDYSSSEVGAVSLDGGTSPMKAYADLGKDPALAVSRGRAFYVARLEGSIFELDPVCGTAIQRISANDSAGNIAANPQDVAVAPDGALWVPRYNVGDLAILGGGTTTRIDLSSYDADGNPQPSAIRIVDTAAGTKAFVALERLDDHDQLLSKQPSQMLRIDVGTRAVEAVVTLAGRNPFNTIVQDGQSLFLAMPGNFADAAEADAGVERFDVTTSTTRLLVKETDLGASVAEVTVHGRCGIAILADATPTINRTSLATFDAETGAVLAKNVIGPSETFDLGLRGLAWTFGGRVLLVGDRARQKDGYPIHAFEPDDACTLHALPDKIYVGQKPVSVRSVR
jgi:hypothetical protein